MREEVRSARASCCRPIPSTGQRGDYTDKVDGTAWISYLKTDESWTNVNAIDDVCYEIMSFLDKYVIAVLPGNGAAGGAFLALAVDEPWARQGRESHAPWEIACPLAQRPRPALGSWMFY